MKLDKNAAEETNQATIHLGNTHNIIVAAFLYVLLCGIIGIQTVTFDGFITTAQREGASDPYSWVFPVFAPLVIYLILCTKNLLRPDNVWSNDIIRGKGVKNNEYQSEITAIRNTLLKATKVYMFIYASINVTGVLYIIYRLYNVNGTKPIATNILTAWEVLSIIYVAYVFIVGRKEKVQIAQQNNI